MSRTTNGAGWEVQAHFDVDGWLGITAPYETKHEAVTEMNCMQSDAYELRVYEALS